MKTTVLITWLNDLNITRTIASLSKQFQVLEPDEIIIADGGSKQKNLSLVEEFSKKIDNVEICLYPGSFGETRRQAINNIKSDIIVFLDADQAANKDWLKNIIWPIVSNVADFTGGPTKPFLEPKNKCQSFINFYEKWYYDNVVKNDITALPMGNSAWRKKIFDDIGNFDDVFVKGGDDFDISMRAVDNGYRGALVKDAWVYHDQSSIDSLGKIFKKKYSYSAGATVAYLKNREFHNKTGNAITTARCMHPIEFMNLIAKTLGFIKGFFDWRKYVGEYN